MKYLYLYMFLLPLVNANSFNNNKIIVEDIETKVIYENMTKLKVIAESNISNTDDSKILKTIKVMEKKYKTE